MKRRLPLEGIVVADFSRVLAGPLCTMMLADAGARVIKIEEPGRGDETRRWGPPFVDGVSAYYLSANRSKESVTLDLRSVEGRGIAARIIERADVVVDNYRQEQKEKLGLTPAGVRSIRPAIIHCSIRGFDAGETTADVPGYDLLAQAAGGLMSITGEPSGEPMKVGVALSDVLTAHHAHGAICAALFARERTGEGDFIEVSLFGTTVASLANVAQSHLMTGRKPGRYGNAHASIVPYQAFHAKDRLFTLAAATDRHYDIFCREVVRRPELASDPRFRTNADRVRNRVVLVPLLEEIFGTRTANHWVRLCRRHQIPAARVDTLPEIFRSPAGAAMVETLEHPRIGPLRMVRSPVRRSAPARRGTAPPELGDSTHRVLRELGLTRREISDLARRHII